MSAYPSQSLWASVQAQALGEVFASATVDPIIRQTERDHASLEAVYARLKATLEGGL